MGEISSAARISTNDNSRAKLCGTVATERCSAPEGSGLKVPDLEVTKEQTCQSSSPAVVSVFVLVGGVGHQRPQCQRLCSTCVRAGL